MAAHEAADEERFEALGDRLSRIEGIVIWAAKAILGAAFAVVIAAAVLVIAASRAHGAF